MSLSVELLNNSSPVEKIVKDLSGGLSFDCTLKDGASILRPVILVASPTDVTGYNYMYISDFSRYYFIDDIKSVRNGQWEISAHVDVLETYKNAILNNSAVVRRQQSQYNLYLDDPDFHAYNYERIQTIRFPANPFSKTLSYILVVNGS